MIANLPWLEIGQLAVAPLTLAQALDEIDRLIGVRRGGFVFTANVDHVVLAESDPGFRAAYAAAALAVADGMPLVWASRLLGPALPERVAGSDLILPLMERASRRGWRVYLLGAAPGVAVEAARRIQARWPVHIVGVDSPRISLPRSEAEDGPALRRLRAAAPDLVLVALGSPKQELWIHAVSEQLGPAVAVGVGAGLDFIAGRARRAPQWISRAGFEWLYRLCQEPRRLWRRYLVNDSRFLGILLRTMGRRRRLLGAGAGQAAKAGAPRGA